MSHVGAVEMRVASAFSFLRGATLPEDLAYEAAFLGYSHVALVDAYGLYGAPRFHAAARSFGVRALVGALVDVEIALEPGLFGPAAQTVRGPVALYARSREGYQNLCRLLTLARLRTPKPIARDHGVCVSLDELAVHRAGLAAMLLADAPPLRDIPRGNSPALRFARALSSVFEKGALYVEQTRHHTRQGQRTSARMHHLAQALGRPCVATNAPLYARAEHAPVADVLACARLRTTLDEAGERLAPNASRVLLAPRALAALFADRPEWIAHARAFAESCEYTLEDLGYRFPRAHPPDGQSESEHLRALVAEGVRRRNRVGNAAFRAQLDRELALIEKLELQGYFLIVWDLVRFCRDEHIMVQGRGSAANSAVCYALEITAVDPVAMGLLFERFLSEERGEWPDIDLDLPSGAQRERVIQYLYARYGDRGAAMTANVITYRPRSAVREAARALGFSEDILARLRSQLSSFGTLDRDALAAVLDAAGLSLHEPRVRALHECAYRLQNLPRHLGQHPGGMVLSERPLDEIVPLEPAAMRDRVVLQWDKDDCNDLGLLKVDLLGLGMMALLEEAVPAVALHDGVRLDLAQLPPDDPATYAMLCRADTVGVFQVESRAQMATLPRMRPERFYDLVVEVAIIRPGPIVGKLVHPYLDRRNGRAPVTYPHEDLRPVLERTLGVPLFQEQLMRVAMVAAGFTGGEAEELRRAMGSKRSAERMAALEAKLRAGMTANGYALDAQEEVVRGIVSFALYGFPESHAASFALLAYASAYLKCHFPATFTCSLLNHWPMGFYHPATVVKDAQRHGVRVRPVDVTRSRDMCTREHDAAPSRPHRGIVRLGLRYVQGLRAQTREAIERARDERAFTSIADFAHRTGARRDELEALAELGALSAIPTEHPQQRWTRRSALWQVQAVAARPPGALFDGHDAHPFHQTDPRDFSLPERDGYLRGPLPEMSREERIAADYRRASMTTGPHPMALRRDALRAQGVRTVREVLAQAHNEATQLAGAVITRQRPQTAKGFFFLTLEDETGIANAIVHPRLYEAQRAVFREAPLLLLSGIVQQQDGVTSVRVVHAMPLRWGEGAPTLPEGHDFH